MVLSFSRKNKGKKIMELFLPTLTQMGFLLLFIIIGFLLVKVKFLPSSSTGVLAKLENSVFIPALV